MAASVMLQRSASVISRVLSVLWGSKQLDPPAERPPLGQLWRSLTVVSSAELTDEGTSDTVEPEEKKKHH